MIEVHEETSGVDGRRLFWDGCINVRDMGGFDTHDGKRTRRGVLVRMDNPGYLTNDGIQAMLNYGVTTVIDLRYPTEITQYPQLTKTVKDQTGAPAIMTLPLLDEANRADEDAAFARSRDAWHEYVLDKRGETLVEVLQAIAHAKPGPVAFHCAAGKDRTGIVSALILDLTGVLRDEIAEDYAVSAAWLEPRTQEWLAPMDEAQRMRMHGLMATPPEYIHHALNYVDQKYGGTLNYLRTVGLSADVINTLRARLLEP